MGTPARPISRFAYFYSYDDVVQYLQHSARQLLLIKYIYMYFLVHITEPILLTVFEIVPETDVDRALCRHLNRLMILSG